MVIGFSMLCRRVHKSIRIEPHFESLMNSPLAWLSQSIKLDFTFIDIETAHKIVIANYFDLCPIFSNFLLLLLLLQQLEDHTGSGIVTAGLGLSLTGRVTSGTWHL